MTGRAFPLLALASVLLTAVAVAPSADAAQGAAVTTLPSRFPAGLEGVATAYVAPHVYFFGGYDGTDGGRTDLIYRLDPATGVLDTMTSRLERPMHGIAAAAAGGKVYLFGGFATVEVPREKTYKDWVQVFDPVADTVTRSDETFAAAVGNPTSEDYGFYYMAAAEQGGMVYVFGGANAEGRLRLVFRYDPATDELTRRTAVLERGLSETAAAAVGGDIYLFGGFESDPGGDGPVDKIRRYNVTQDRVETIVGTLAEPLSGVAAAAGGHNDAYLFGGQRYNREEVRTVQRFRAGYADPAAADLPGPRTRAAAAWTGQDFIVAGGLDGETRIRDLVRYRPSPGELTASPTPRSSSPVAGSGQGETGGDVPAGPAWTAGVALVGVLLVLRPRRR